MRDFYNWHKIDIHSHTLNQITTDGKKPKSNYTHEGFYYYLKSQHVDIKAVTNHNTLYLEDHVKHALICELLDIHYFAGVEIDYMLTSNSKPFHAITIPSPKTDIVRFSKILQDIVNNKISNGLEVKLSKDEFAKLHASTEFIFIPHATKAKGIFENRKTQDEDIDNINWISESIISGMSMPIILENTQDHHSYSVTAKIIKEINKDDVIVSPTYALFTDYTFDGDEKRASEADDKESYYIYAEPTYRGLEISIRHHESRFSLGQKILLRDNFVKNINIKSTKHFEESSIELSPSLNVIIGKSGSGKTLLLNELYYKITGNPSLRSIDNRKDSEKSKNKSPYHNLTNEKDILDVEYIKSVSDLNHLEVPKVYSAILNHKDVQSIKETLSIDTFEDGSSIMNKYKSKIAEYEKHLQRTDNLIADGTQHLKNIDNAIKFLEANTVKKETYHLSEKIFDDRLKTKLKNIIERVDKYLSEKNKLIKYFEGMQNYLGEKGKDSIQELIVKYNLILDELELSKSDKLSKLKVEQIEEKIVSIINTAIKSSSEYLGQKQRSVKDRQQTKSSQDLELTKAINNYLKTEYLKNSTNLDFPYDEILTTIDKNQFDDDDEFIKLKFDCTKEDLKEFSLNTSNLINSKNIKTKLNNIDDYDFLDSISVKKCIDELKDEGLLLSTILCTSLPTSLNFLIDGQWKPKEKINPGTLSIKFTEYYFNKLIRDKQPDIIFIDQPENDIDKEFISNTLTKFIREQKIETQIIMTTHDPILAVNADANSIIIANVMDNNKFKYESLKMETINEDTNEYIGTDNVSRILDGGKENIKLRYQIYGGILDE